MKIFKLLSHCTLIALLATGLSACKTSNDSAEVPTNTPQAPATQAAANVTSTPDMLQQATGTVLETIDTAGYTYIRVKTADKELWAAAPQFKVAVGDSVIIPEGMAMPNYHSNTLNRDFDVVYFVNSVLVPGADLALNAQPESDPHAGVDAAAMAHQKPATAVVDIDFSTLTKPENGLTIAEIFARQAELATHEVTLRAKVVKFSPNIMKTNWIHLQDGTGSAGTNDLTITTKEMAGVGDTVLVKGILDLNQDFGYGYQYDVIIQNAEVTVE